MNEVERELLQLFSAKEYQTDILSAGNYRFPANYHYEAHSHREIELNYITSGTCIMKVGEKVIPLARGNCILIRPFESHSFLTNFDRTCRLAQIVFSVSLPAVILEHIACLTFERAFYVLENCEIICSIMDNISRYHRLAWPDGFEQAQLDFSLLQLYAALSGNIQKLQRYEGIHEGKLGMALDLIARQLQYDIHLEDISKKIGVSSRYLRREFSSKLNMSCTAFITALRLEKAKELLWNSSKSIHDIALLTGFGSSQYFCRIFKKHTDMTPLQYRSLWNDAAMEEQSKQHTEEKSP